MFIALHLLLIASPPQEPACVQKLGELLERKDYEKVLADAEACHKHTKNPRPLYFIGSAELAKRRSERAIESLQRYLASDVQAEPPMLLKKADDELRQAKSQVVDLALEITPRSSNEDTVVTIGHPDWNEPIVAVFSEFDKGGRATVALPPGNYHVTVSRAGFIPERRHLAIVQSSIEKISLEPRPLLVAEKAARNAWVGSWVGIGGALAGAGIGVVAAAGRSSRSLLEKDLTSEVEIDRDRGKLAQATMLRAGGAGMLGAGLGLIVGGFTGLAPSKRTRKIVFASELGVGGVLAVTGIIFLRVARVSFNQVNNSVASGLPRWGPDFEELLKPGVRGYVVAAALLGAGLGLGLSSAVGLLSPKLVRKRSGMAARWNVLSDGFAVKF